MLIDQLLFGYRDGHRQLAGSMNLDRHAAAILLGATDAMMGGETDHLLTGLPLHAEGLYALSVTWPAPEIDRPGAVWSHTLLIQFGQLGELFQPASLFRHARRPQTTDLDGYGEPLEIDPALVEPLSPDVALMDAVLTVAIEETRPTVVVHPSLKVAQETLLSLWSIQWPGLRERFSFRTRETTRFSSNAADLVVARRVKGMTRRDPTVEALTDSERPMVRSRWLGSIGKELLKPGPLARFLGAFGPHEPPQLGSLIFLGDLFGWISEGNIRAARRELEHTHPRSAQASKLKTALFGPRASEWWTVSDLELLSEILGTRRSLFDVRALRLKERMEALVRDGLAPELVAARNRSGPKSVRNAFLEAMRRAATLETLVQIAETDKSLTWDLLRLREDWATNPKLWNALSPQLASEAMSEIELTTPVIVAAARAGQYKALLSHISLLQLIEKLAISGRFKLIARAARSALAESAVLREESSDPRQLLLLAAGGVIPDDPRSLLTALEDARHSPDEVWLRGAVTALATGSNGEARTTLGVVFGPLHHAITDDRLPHDLWAKLDLILPPATDPALRLRRYLVERASDEDWSVPELARALRDGGPHIGQLKKEVAKDDPIREVLKSAMRSSA